MPNTTGEVTQLLHDVADGDRASFDVLLARVYEELQKLARIHLHNERADHTLNTSDLVHEAYLRLVDHRKMEWQNRAHFFGTAARAMRRILIDYARSKSAQKRQGEHVTLSGADNEEGRSHTVSLETVIAVNQALEELEAVDARLVRVVEARFFAGLTIRETAEILDISHATVSRDWRLARAWLKKTLSAAD